MSIHGDWVTGTIASSGTSTGEINLGVNADFLNIALPALTSGTITIQVTDIGGGTYQNLGSSINLPATTGGYTTTLRLGGYQYIKVVSSVAQASARTIKVRGIKI